MSIQLPSVGQDSNAYHPHTAADARSIIAQEGQVHSVVVYFEKKDGSPRRMVARYYGHTSRSASHLTVWDVEKGALRVINLETVHTIKVCQSAPQKPAQAPQPVDREAARQRTRAMVAELAEMF